MFKRYVYIFVVLFSLLFNTQTAFAHDIEHVCHDHESHESLIDCKDCLLKHHLDKSPDFSNSCNFDFLKHTNVNDNYLINNTIVYTFVAYQSQAP